MNLLIMGIGEAMEHTPTTSTYAIRIDLPKVPFGEYFCLRTSSLYTIVTYAFDDITPDFGRGKLFDQTMAQELLLDFKNRGLTQDTLLVHCLKGKNRSPAVGIALNEIFGLGQDTAQLKKQYFEANTHVYNTLLETAQRSSILK